jgi:ribosomal protein S30
MPAKHVQQYVNNAQNIAKENRRWRNVKNYAERVLMLAVSVQRHAEA